MTNVIKFYRVNEPYGCFSNFSKHPIYIQTTWPTSEHYFQAQKFLDSQPYRQILHTKSPMEAAKIGRSRQWPIRPDWEAVKVDVMRIAIRQKLLQHSDVRETLISTGDALIVEHTANDSFWRDGGDGNGRNMLGKILMQARDVLTSDGQYDELASPMIPPWEKHPEIPYGSIGWRMGYGESYALDWSIWYKGLTEAGRQKYRDSLNIPEEWTSWLGAQKK